MASITSLASSGDPYEQLISQVIRIEREPQFELRDRRNEEKRFKAVLGDFDSKLSELHGQLKSFTDPFASPFEARAATGLDDAAGFSVAATDDAAFGNHAVEVERLAAADTRISKQLQASGTTLRDFFDQNGAQTFSLQVASPTEDDPENRVAVDVSVDPTGATDEEILGEISGAVTTAMADAASDDRIKRTERPSASVINETSDTARLSLRSGETGFAGRLEFEDSAGGLLAALGVTNDAVAEGTGGGQVTAVGTSETDSQLNSKFTLDGLTLYRSSNQVADALDGLTLDLKKAGEPKAAFSVAPDAESIKEDVTGFIDKYNGVLGFIQRKGNVDGETGARGDFAGERAFTNLRFNMRNDAVRTVPGQPAGSPSSLQNLGIEIQRDGTLKLEDEDALVAAIEKDSAAVQSLFASDDGVATRLEERLNRFVRAGGVIDNREKSVDRSVRRLDNRIERWDERLTSREEILRKQFSELRSAISVFQGQQQFLGGFLQ